LLLTVLSLAMVAASASPPASVPPPSSPEDTIVVDSPADDGPGTLRWALEEAQNGDTITFDPTVFPPTSPVTISITSELPHIQQGNLAIDASNAGVILDGRGVSGGWSGGLQIVSSDGNRIQGLHVTNFSGAAIAISGAARHNVIGGDPSIGAGPFGQGNLLSRCDVGIGLWWDGATGASFNTITGNLIGTDAGGAADLGNGQGIAIVENCSDNTIGPDNIIAHNQGNGISVSDPGSISNTITQNSIYHNGGQGIAVSAGASYNIVAQTSIHDNGEHGIALGGGAAGNTIGPGNIIAHNDGCGIEIHGPDSLHNTITQNSIHSNTRDGILLADGGNTGLYPPTVFDFDLTVGMVNGFACAGCTVEVFSDSADEGEVYEGQATADSNGVFDFTKGVSFTEPHLTASATDTDGNTSWFSSPTSGTLRTLSLQQGNHLPRSPLLPRPSQSLPDNHIGPWFEDHSRYYDTDFVYRNGFKRMRIGSLAGTGQYWMTVINSESLSEQVDETITAYADNGVEIVLILASGAGLPFSTTTFQSEEEIEQYLEYVTFAVSHFKGRIRYYEIWNEPGHIAVPDYANLVERAVEVIRPIDPDAKIIIGAIQGDWVDGYPGYGEYQRFSVDMGYLNALLVSGVASLADGISWHPMYDNVPSDPYYQDYPELVSGIKELAASEGFAGEYFADEIMWTTVDEPNWDNGPPVSQHIAAKYYARTIVEHRGLGINVTINTFFQVPRVAPVRNLCDTLAGAEPADTALSIASEITVTRQYAFSLPNGDRLVALWTNGIALDYDPGITATVTLTGFADHTVAGIDAFYGFEQPILTHEEDGDLIIRDLLVRDYPIILRVSPIVSPALVAISGPVAGLVDATYSFTATVDPITVTMPMTYTWQATGQPAVTHAGSLTVTDSVSYTWATTGTRIITVTARNGGGAVTSTHSVTIYEPPAADFVGTPTSGLAPLTVAFTNTSTGDYTDSLWQFGDGVTSTLQSPTHTYATVGAYTVTLSIEGPGGEATQTKAAYIGVELFKAYLPLVARDG
jgi:PKD repeat protein